MTAHILVFHVLQVLQLSVSPFGVDHRLERTNQLLHGHLHVVLRVERCTEERKTEFILLRYIMKPWQSLHISEVSIFQGLN